MGGLLETGNRLSRVIRCACSCFICFFKQIERRTSYRANIPCLSLWERWPSAARTERVDTKNMPVSTLKICQWHIFSVDLSGYAAVASILVCTAPSFSSGLGSYILLRCPKFRCGI